MADAARASAPSAFRDPRVSALPPWKRYAYILLYDAVYMLDDMIMVGIAVATLGHHKLQQRGGSWLKLLSGDAHTRSGVAAPSRVAHSLVSRLRHESRG